MYQLYRDGERDVAFVQCSSAVDAAEHLFQMNKESTMVVDMSTGEVVCERG